MRNPLVCAVLCGVVTAGCGGGDKDEPDKTAGHEPVPEAPAKVTAQCVDLPGAARTNLRKSRDGKAIYYVEAVYFDTDGERRRRLDLFSFDVATATPTRVIEDVSDEYDTTADGTIVFSRQGKKHDYLDQYEEQIFAKPPGKEPVPLSKAGETISGFAIDEQSASVVYCGGDSFADSIYTVPIAGGTPKKIGDGYQVYGVSKQGRGVYVNKYQGYVGRVPIAGGEAEDFTGITPGGFIAEIAGNVLFIDGEGALSTIPGATPANAVATKLDLPALTDMIARDVGDKLLVTGSLAGKLVAFMTDGTLTMKQLTTDRVRIAGLVALEGGRSVVLARHDTDGDGEFEVTDESDLCAIQGARPDEAVAFDVRAVPKRYVPVAAKLATLTEQVDLKGAALRLVHSELRGVTSLAIESPESGPTEIAALHERARAVQAQVLALAGMDKLEVSIRYLGNGRRADSSWDADAARYLAAAGFGTALLTDPTEYSFEIDPAVKIAIEQDPYSYGTPNSIGRATCTGTVKNITDAVLTAISVVCSNHTVIGTNTATAKLVPTKLEPGATGKYSIVITVADGDNAFPITLLVGDKPAAYRNAYAEKKIAEVLEVAAAVQAATGLAYEWTGQRTTGTSYDRKTVRVAVMKVPAAFEAAGAAKQAALVSTANDLFRAYYSRADDDDPMDLEVELIRHDNDKTGWVFRDGTLIKEKRR